MTTAYSTTKTSPLAAYSGGQVIDQGTGEIVSSGRDYYASKIRASWQKATDSILETCANVAEAKANLPHGEFEDMVDEDLPFGPSTARRLMAINDHPLLSNRAHGHDLPPSWRTLYELTKLPAPFVEEMLESGKLTPETQRKEVSKWLHQEKRHDRRVQQGASGHEYTGGLLVGDMRELGAQVPDESVDLIFTDPPYLEENIPLYSDLSALAARVLKPGGVCLSYGGKVFLPEIVRRLGEHLEYAWTCCERHSGGNPRIFKVNITTGWKPIFWYFKPPLNIYWEDFLDVVSGGREKDDHEWQQAESEAAYFIERMCPENGVVFDPFAGSGTTLAAAEKLGRKWIGIEANPETAAKIRARLNGGAK